MTATDKKLIDFCLWLFAVMVLAILLTSCAPVIGLQVPTATAQPTAAPTHSTIKAVGPTPSPTCTVNAGRVYLRSGAGMSHAVIDVLHSGDVLRVIAAGDWLKVHLPSTAGAGTTRNQAGFVYSKYCTPR